MIHVFNVCNTTLFLYMALCIHIVLYVYIYTLSRGWHFGGFIGDDSGEYIIGRV